MVAKPGELGEQSLGHVFGGTAVEIAGTKVSVFNAIFQDVIDCREQGSGHRAGSFLRAAPAFEPIELRLVVAVFLAAGRPGLQSQHREQLAGSSNIVAAR